MNLLELETIPQAQKEAVLQYVTNVRATFKTKELTARQLGISPAQMYDFINADWAKISLDAFNRMAQNVGIERTWNIVETANFKKIRGAFNAAQRLSNMYALLGETGTGKSTAAKYLAAKMDNVFYVLADATMSRLAFMDAVLSSMGLQAYNYRNASAKMTAICQKLMASTKPLLVIDDCGKLKTSTITLIQIIYDRTANRSGILLMGTETLYELVVHNAENNKFHMREFYGRVGHWDKMSYPSEKDIADICVQNGVTDASAQKWLFNTTASLHTLENMVRKALEVAKAKNEPVTGGLLAQFNSKFIWMDTHFQNFDTRLSHTKKIA